MKNLILLLVVVVACVNLAGCGGDTKTKSCAECGKSFTAAKDSDTLCETCSDYIKDRESGGDNEGKAKGKGKGKNKSGSKAPTGSSAAK